MIIAIDGPAASGKGTLAKRLAAHYGFGYLDTGMLNRAVARAVIAVGHDPGDTAAAVRAARALDHDSFDDPALRSREMGEGASRVAAIPEVREALMQMQRAFPAGRNGAVVEGRDIGTVIFPEADLKLFVTADLEARAQRRFLELSAAGESISEAAVLADVARRDERDQNRPASPLRIAPGAHLLDTTKLDIEAAFFAAVRIIDAAMTA